MCTDAVYVCKYITTLIYKTQFIYFIVNQIRQPIIRVDLRRLHIA
jgi:hypothetical protein